MTVTKAEKSPLYVIEYRTLSHISGPLVFVENVQNVGYNEIVELRGGDGQVRRGQVLEVDQGRAVVQVFAGTRGLDLAQTQARFSGDVARLGVSLEMLSRILNGSGQPIDGCAEVAEGQWPSTAPPGFSYRWLVAVYAGEAANQLLGHVDERWLVDDRLGVGLRDLWCQWVQGC